MNYRVLMFGITLILLSEIAHAEGSLNTRDLINSCKVCHNFTQKKGKFGPHLFKLIGRKVASLENYQYSNTLLSIGGVWTEERLSQFLNDPKIFAPGNQMKFGGFKNLKNARSAAAYFSQLTKRQLLLD